MGSVTRYIGTVPDYTRDGDNIIITHEGMEPHAMPEPVFRAAAFKAMALVKEIDQERRSRPAPVPIRRGRPSA